MHQSKALLHNYLLVAVVQGLLCVLSPFSFIAPLQKPFSKGHGRSTKSPSISPSYVLAHIQTQSARLLDYSFALKTALLWWHVLAMKTFWCHNDHGWQVKLQASSANIDASTSLHFSQHKSTSCNVFYDYQLNVLLPVLSTGCCVVFCWRSLPLTSILTLVNITRRRADVYCVFFLSRVNLARKNTAKVLAQFPVIDGGIKAFIMQWNWKTCKQNRHLLFFKGCTLVHISQWGRIKIGPQALFRKVSNFLGFLKENKGGLVSFN